MPTRRLAVRRALTVTELLCGSVAVAALGATVLLPIVRGTRQQTELATCLGNLQHLAYATQLYLIDSKDFYPLYVKSADGKLGTDSWQYGGRTGSDWWRVNRAYGFHTLAERPINPYLLAGELPPDIYDGDGGILYRAEVPMLRCPADKRTYVRAYDAEIALSLGPPETDIVLADPGSELTPCSTYDDVGTSYHFNLAAIFSRGSTCDVRRAGLSAQQMTNWLWFQGGLTTTARDLVRDVLYKLPSKFTMYFEDPMDWGLNQSVQTVGNHGEPGWHTMGFLDGHAAYRFVDTRQFCGTEWFGLNPEWLRPPSEPLPPVWAHRGSGNVYYYSNYIRRRCQDDTDPRDWLFEPPSKSKLP